MFLDMAPNDPESWYPDPPRRSITVQIFQHQALWDNRQYPRIHQAFSEIWGTEKLWVSIDRTSMNPPERKDWKHPHRLHWDIFPLEPPFHYWIQGVLYLTDTAADQGAFTCVPGFHRQLEGWLKALPPDADPQDADWASLGVQPVPGAAGDLIMWHNGLPHGSSPNMYPAREDDEALRSRRINAWRNRLAGLIIEASGKTWELSKEKEHEIGQTAELLPLGRKLLALDRWED